MTKSFEVSTQVYHIGVNVVIAQRLRIHPWIIPGWKRSEISVTHQVLSQAVNAVIYRWSDLYCEKEWLLAHLGVNHHEWLSGRSTRDRKIGECGPDLVRYHAAKAICSTHQTMEKMIHFESKHQ